MNQKPSEQLAAAAAKSAARWANGTAIVLALPGYVLYMLAHELNPDMSGAVLTGLIIGGVIGWIGTYVNCFNAIYKVRWKMMMLNTQQKKES